MLCRQSGVSGLTMDFNKFLHKIMFVRDGPSDLVLFKAYFLSLFDKISGCYNCNFDILCLLISWPNLINFIF